MAFVLKPTRNPDDFHRLVEISNQHSNQPHTFAELQGWVAHRPQAELHYERVAVNEEGLVVGYGDLQTSSWSKPTEYWLTLEVDQHFLKQGIGNLLYNEFLNFSHKQGATKITGWVPEKEEESLKFASNRGFEVERHIFESSLDLAKFDPTPFKGLVEGVEARGFRFFNMVEGAKELNDPGEANRRMYELMTANSRDIPGFSGLVPPFEEFEKEILEDALYLPDAQIIVAQGGKWVGITSLIYYPQNNSAYTNHTGVLPDYRGQHLAMALKLLGIERAKKFGAANLRTNNDAANAPILAINRKLGYEPLPGKYRVKLENP